jgi:hypothetical protein
MTKHLVNEPMPTWLLQCQAAYQRALDAATAARKKCSDSGRWYVDYWIGRLIFALGYVDCVALVRETACAEARITEANSDKAAQSARALAQEKSQNAVQCARAMLDAYANVARGRSDHGAIAVMSEYIYRPLKDKAEQLAR